jgi:hypothetical protein
MSVSWTIYITAAAIILVVEAKEIVYDNRKCEGVLESHMQFICGNDYKQPFTLTRRDRQIMRLYKPKEILIRSKKSKRFLGRWRHTSMYCCLVGCKTPEYNDLCEFYNVWTTCKTKTDMGKCLRQRAFPPRHNHIITR